jgi:hypothetical protein
VTTPTPARDIIAEARSAAGQLRRTRTPYSVVLMPFVDAQLHVLEGRLDKARDVARVAYQQCTERPYYMRPQAAYLLGVLEGGDNGRELRTLARSLLVEQGWTNPMRAIETSCPALRFLERTSDGPAQGR